MNGGGGEPLLLPRPRSIDVGRGRVPVAEPATSWDPSLPAEGYRLRVSGDGVRLAAADPAGMAHGRATLAQLATPAGPGPAGLPEVDIEDWPDLPRRGFMLDISRDKVPTMAELRRLVDQMAAWKLNHLQLYTEHTFAYAGHDEVWRAASPMTPDEVGELERYCAARHVELAANQNCLGHMDRWLAHDRYRPLALTPAGWRDGRGRPRHPTTLDPVNPGSLALVRDLLAQLLGHFRSPIVNVGLDEPWELPPERVPDYLRYLEQLRGVPELSGREMLMWGDIVAAHRELVGELPDGVTVCEWGYEADHPFAERAARLAAAGRAFWLCPGTSSWNSVLGRWTNARLNCLRAVEVALATGAKGCLVTDWGDNGHLQPPAVSAPGMALAAGAMWCLGANRALDVAAALDRFYFADPGGAMGRALLELGDVHRLIEPQLPNISTLVLHLYFPQAQVGVGFTRGLDGAQLDRAEAALDGAVGDLRRGRPDRDDGVLTVDELAHAAGVVRLACDDARARLRAEGTIGSVPEPARRRLAQRVDPLVEEHRRLWLARNRPGGLPDSAARLEHLRRCYEEGRGAGFVPSWLAPLGDVPAPSAPSAPSGA